MNIAEDLLGDLAGFRGFRKEASELAEDLDSYCRDQFENWSSEMLLAIEDPGQPLGLVLLSNSSSMMSFYKF